MAVQNGEERLLLHTLRQFATLNSGRIDAARKELIFSSMLAVPRETSGVAMAATRALVRRGVKRLHLVTLPTSTLQADLLIGAGCVETLETSAVSLGEFGPAPRFTAAVLSGVIQMRDSFAADRLPGSFSK